MQKSSEKKKKIKSSALGAGVEVLTPSTNEKECEKITSAHICFAMGWLIFVIFFVMVMLISYGWSELGRFRFSTDYVKFVNEEATLVISYTSYYNVGILLLPIPIFMLLYHFQQMFLCGREEKFTHRSDAVRLVEIEVLVISVILVSTLQFLYFTNLWWILLTVVMEIPCAYLLYNYEETETYFPMPLRFLYMAYRAYLFGVMTTQLVFLGIGGNLGFSQVTVVAFWLFYWNLRVYILYKRKKEEYLKYEIDLHTLFSLFFGLFLVFILIGSSGMP